MPRERPNEASRAGAPSVVVYTTSWCPWCSRAKTLLHQRGIRFEEVDAEDRWGPAFREELDKLTGRRTVPQVVIDGRAIGGYDALVALDEKGELQRLAS